MVEVMRWFAVPVVFAVEAPTEEAAVLLAEQRHVGELIDLLGYPELSVSAFGEDVDGDVASRFERFLIAVTVTLEAGDANAARTTVEQAVADLASTYDLREVRQAEPVADPRLLAEETKDALLVARDWLTDHLAEDVVALREGEKFNDLMILPNVLPACFAQHYTPELVEQLAAVVERVAEKLAAYPDTYLASTIEELAAHAVLDEARESGELRAERLAADRLAVVAQELEDLRDFAFEDHDVLLLFHQQFDGIEASEIAESMGMANLHVRDWFTPFRSGRQ